MDNLDYEKHLESYKNLYGFYANNQVTHKKNALENAQKEAQFDHCHYVFNAIQDLFLSRSKLASKLKNADAKYYITYGAGRRLSMIFFAYKAITHIAPPKRVVPLSHEEQMELNRDINILYINLRGVFDNYAYCFMHEHAPDLENELRPMDKSLFSQKFRKKCSAFNKIKEDILKHDDWEREVKERRDPAAHRIPLYVPHTIITGDEEEKRYNFLDTQYHEKLNNIDFEASDKAFDEIHKVGKFYPCFLHHPDKPVIPIYPTIPTDLVHLIRICAAVEKGLIEPMPTYV